MIINKYILNGCYHFNMGFPVGTEVKAFACNEGHQSSIPGSENLLEKEMATHSSILAWRVPWMEESGGLQSMGLQRVGHDWAIFTFTFPGNSVVKNPPASARDVGLNIGLGRSLGEGNGNPLQYFCLGNPMERGARWAAVNGDTKIQTWLSD